MGFSVLLHSGIFLGAEQFRATGSSLFGNELSYRKISLRQRAQVENKFVGKCSYVVDYIPGCSHCFRM